MYSKKGFIYLMKPKGSDRKVYKIGTSVDPENRLSVKQKEVKYEIELVASVPVLDSFGIEQFLHDRYSKYRLAGEWFVLPYDVVDDFVNMVNTISETWIVR